MRTGTVDIEGLAVTVTESGVRVGVHGAPAPVELTRAQAGALYEVLEFMEVRPGYLERAYERCRDDVAKCPKCGLSRVRYDPTSGAPSFGLCACTPDLTGEED